MADIAERKAELLLVTDNFIERYQEWCSSDLEYLSQAFEKSLDEIGEVFAEGDVPASCRELFEAVRVLKREWIVWQSIGEQNGEKHPQDDSFWRAVRRIVESRQGAAPKNAVVLEPIHGEGGLLEQGVSHRQIALIYGFLNEDGTPNMQMVAEEIKKPGTHVNDGYITPAERDRIERERKMDESIKRLQQLREKKKAVNRQPPESLESLIDAGVSMRQITAILGIEESEVERMCKEHGYPIPESNYSPLTPKEEKDDGRNPYPDDPEVEEMIIELAGQGMEPRDIVAELKSSGKKATQRKVKDVLIRAANA